MSTDKERIERLEESYRKLWEQHVALKESIRQNYAEFKEIREKMGVPEASGTAAPTPKPQPVPEVKTVVAGSAGTSTRWPDEPRAQSSKEPEKSSLEQYIGEQLLSKIGIAILVIGVGIGAKYAIDHQLLSPTMRIAGGYLVAAILGFFAFRFRQKYASFSAILVSGAMAVTYFITYAAYDFYHLYPYWFTFTLLLLTTAATVACALRYNLVVIAHIGLVGAYMLPALISRNENNMVHYLAYIAVINGGILVISFLRSWKSLYHLAFAWTTLVFVIWTLISYDETTQKATALFFLCLFFVLFQLVTLGYPLVRKHAFRGLDLLLVVPNMLSFFVMGRYILHDDGSSLFTADFIFGLMVAALFFVLWRVFRTLRPEDKLLQESHFVIGSGALTLTLLLELDGAHLPFALLVECCILGWLGLQSRWRFLDIFTTVLVGITGCTLLYSIFDLAYDMKTTTPFLNEGFALSLAGVLLAGATFAIFRKRFERALIDEFTIENFMLFYALIGGFCVIAAEIVFYYRHALELEKQLLENKDLYFHYYGQWEAAMWMTLTAFSAVYWAFVVWLGRKVIPFKNGESWIPVTSAMLIGILLLFISFNSDWRFSKELTTGNLATIYSVMRYLSFAGIVAIGWSWLKRAGGDQKVLTVVHLAVLWMLSLEMTHWLNVNNNVNAYKLSLSVLWGIYAIYILYVGIVRSFSTLRIAAMIVLGITLVKLFFFDIAKLSMLSRTIIFILLGALLLVGAYFYQRYKDTEEKENKE